MAMEAGSGHAAPQWFVEPGAVDWLAWIVLAMLCGAIYGIVTLYAYFDRWAEHKSSGTPLAKTIPTLLTIALLYEVFPLDHFSVLLPVSAILIALMADWARYHDVSIGTSGADGGEAEAVTATAPLAEPLVPPGEPPAARTEPVVELPKEEPPRA